MTNGVVVFTKNAAFFMDRGQAFVQPAISLGITPRSYGSENPASRPVRGFRLHKKGTFLLEDPFSVTVCDSIRRYPQSGRPCCESLWG